MVPCFILANGDFVVRMSLFLTVQTFKIFPELCSYKNRRFLQYWTDTSSQQMVEQGFAALAIMAQCWEDSMPEEGEQKESSEVWVSGRVTIVIALSTLLQQAWLRPAELMVSI